MGRLNYGHLMYDPKGLTTDVTLDGDAAAFKEWKAWTLPLEYSEVSLLDFTSVANCRTLNGPTFLKGELNIDGAPADTYLKPRGFTKGVMWVNGFNLGRYWETKGPQHAFFAPAPYLKSGANEVLILELERGSTDCSAFFDDKPDWGNDAKTCPQSPQEGDVLRMVPCDATLEEHQGWEVVTAANITRLKLGNLCMTLGDHKDVQSGQPSAQLSNCEFASAVIIDGARIREADTGLCLDVTAHGQVDGQPLEWYTCNTNTKTNTNQMFSFTETPSHLNQVISAESGKCVSSCTKPLVFLV